MDHVLRTMESRPSPNQKHDNTQQGLPPETMAVESLPLETRCPPYPLRQYGGFWLPENMVRVAIPAIHTHFRPRPSDVILVSFVKSGTTWLKALAFATLNRAVHPPLSNDHPLRRSSPHDCVRFLDLGFMLAESVDNFSNEVEALHSPRLFAMHLPYSLLPRKIREVCRIVYICREPKDALVSWWFFIRKAAASLGGDASSFTFQKALDLFCHGSTIFGPQWQHVLEYWKASSKRPDKVLFLRYEEMLLDPRGKLTKLAKFMRCGFTAEEEERRRVVDDIVELCSLDSLKNMKVNRSERGNNLPIKNADFFRKGVIGDWSNLMTPEMALRLDKIVEDALQGSGFTFSGDST